MEYSIVKSKFQNKYIFLFLYLSIILTIIKCEIKIFPDHHALDDPNFNRSQVKKITNESFYYDLGYFTNKTEKYRSPKYGINYRPVQCQKISENDTDPIYNDDDTVSFFGANKPIRDQISTLEMENKFEETKLFRNTIKGYNFSCPSPIRSFHSPNFEINFTIPMIAEDDMTIDIYLVSEDGAVNNSIGTVELQANKYEKITFFIFPQEKEIYNTSKMIFKFKREGNLLTPPLTTLSIVGDPDLSIQFISQEAKNLILSNYRVTITDLTTITGTPFNRDTMIRSKNGLLSNCTKDSDCFIGFMCNYFNCTPCHTSCTECVQDDLNAAGMNYCKECNVMSTTEKPHDGYCDIGYVDVTMFKDFEAKITPDGKDFNDRETLGFWIFFTDTELSRKREKEKRPLGLADPPENEDILHHIVLKNRFVITIIQKIRKISVYCHVYENIFARNTTEHTLFHYEPPNEKFDINGKRGERIKRYFTPHQYYYLNFTVPSEAQKEKMVEYYFEEDKINGKTIDGHWVHVSCAESFDHGLYYLKTVINGQTEYKEDHLYHEPMMRTFEGGNLVKVDVMNDKYFKPIIYDDNVLHLQFLNFQLSNSKIYLRHLTLFKEYIPPKMQYMYFDYSGITNFYELLYYIPFNQLIYGNVYKIKGYSYENVEEDIILTLNDTTQPDEIIGDVSPPLNFIHLNFPKVNHKYKEIDLRPDETELLLKTDDMKYVYDDNLPMCCKYYLNIETNQCTDTCTEFRKLPYPGVHLESGYCDYTCSDSMSCIKDHPSGEDLNYDGPFCTVLSKAYNLFYRCEDNQIDYYFQFSGFYNSSKMEKKIPEMKSYLIEFWYFDDYLLKELREKFFGDPSHERHYVLHTNVIDAFFLIDTDTITGIKDNIQRTVGVQYREHYLYYNFKGLYENKLLFRHREWNRFFVHSKYNRTEEKYDFRICLNYYRYTDRDDETGRCGGVGDLLHPSIGTLENIIFCDKVCEDWENKPIHWATGYYKNFRIWDGNNVSPSVLAQYDSFFPDYIDRVSALKYYFPMTNKYISNNIIFDPKNKEFFSITPGKYFLKKYNFASHFDIIATQNLYGKGYCINIKDLKVRGSEVKDLRNCNKGCERCWATNLYQDRCYKCSVGYYLGEEYHCHPIGNYFFKSPSLINRKLEATISKVTLMS